jgi:transposase
MMPARRSNGRKRHLLTDTLGLPVAAVVHPADIQDRDGAPLVLASARFLYPWLRHIFADGGYAGAKLATALDKIGRWTVQNVKRSDAATGFVVLPQRSVATAASPRTSRPAWKALSPGCFSPAPNYLCVDWES